MKRTLIKIVGVAFVAFLMAGCGSELQVFSDADPDMDVLVYKTYSWPDGSEIESRNNPLLYNELTDKRIRKAVDFQLRKNGYVRRDSLADLKVHYHIVVKDKQMVRLDDPHADSYTPYWLVGDRSTYNYEEGTLIVDLMESRSCNLIWRGWAVGVIEEYTTTLNEEEITRAVNKIFQNYSKHPHGPKAPGS